MPNEIQISKRIVLANSVSSIVARVLNVGVLVWLQRYLLERISAEEYSLYPIVMSIMVFVPLATSILKSGIARYAVEAKAVGDRDRVTQIVSTMTPLLVGASVFILVLGSLVIWKIDVLLTISANRVSDAQWMMVLLVVSIAIRLPMIPYMSGFFITQRLVLANLIRLAGEFLRIALLFVFLFGISTRVIWVVLAAVIADVIRSVVMMQISRRLVPELRFGASEVRWALAREIISFGTWRFVGQLADRLLNSADVLILNKLATPVDVTSFHVGSLPRRVLNDTISQASMPLVPPMTAMHARGGKADLRNVYLRGGRIALWMSLIFAMPAMVFHREIIFLYLEGRYQDAGVVMLLMLATLPLTYGHLMLPQLATATAEVRPFAIRMLIVQVINVVLTLVLVGYFKLGAIGSALGTLIVSATLIPMMTWSLGFEMANLRFSHWARHSLWPGLVPSIAGLVVWMGIQRVIEPATWTSLGLACVAGMLAYVAALFLFAMSEADRKDLAKVMAAMRLRMTGGVRR